MIHEYIVMLNKPIKSTLILPLSDMGITSNKAAKIILINRGEFKQKQLKRVL